MIHCFYDIIDWWWKSIKSHFQLGPLLDILTNTNMTNLELDMNKCRTNDPNLLNQAKLQWKPIHHHVTGGSGVALKVRGLFLQSPPCDQLRDSFVIGNDLIIGRTATATRDYQRKLFWVAIAAVASADKALRGFHGWSPRSYISFRVFKMLIWLFLDCC